MIRLSRCTQHHQPIMDLEYFHRRGMLHIFHDPWGK
jgi:hypothetical protein